MQKKETKKEQSFIEKYLPVLANKKVFERS
jgi:hypothetical protein